MAVATNINQGGTGAGLAFNLQASNPGLNSGQAFATPSGNVAFQPTGSVSDQLSTRLGDLLTQTSRISANVSSTANTITVQTNVQPSSQSVSQSTTTPTSGNPTVATGQTITQSANQAPSVLGTPSRSDASVPGLTLQPQATNPTALADPTSVNMPINQAPIPTGQSGPGLFATFSPDLLVPLALVTPYGAGVGADQTKPDPARDQSSHKQKNNRDDSQAPDNSEADGVSLITLPLPEGLYAVDDERDLTIGMQDRNAGAVIVQTGHHGRIARIVLRELSREIHMGILLVDERVFDLQMRPLEERLVECAWPATQSDRFRKARCHFERMLPVTDPKGNLRAIADFDMASRKGGLTIAPILIRDPTTSLLAIVGFSLILAQNTANGPECLWRSFDLKGRPSTLAADGTAVQEPVAALGDSRPPEG